MNDSQFERLSSKNISDSKTKTDLSSVETNSSKLSMSMKGSNTEASDNNDYGSIRKRKLTDGEENPTKIRRKQCGLSAESLNKNDESICTMSEGSQDHEIYHVQVSNLPLHWDHGQIQKFIDDECGPFDSIQILADNCKNYNGNIKLAFETLEKAETVKKKLEHKQVDGNKLNAEIIGDPGDSQSLTDTLEQDDKLNNTYRPDLDVWTADPKGLYGLKEQYLKSLNIEPPLYNGVLVSNFRCEKNELLEVMQLAGTVIMIGIRFSMKTPRFARVIYSHPLEALQAVSLLRGQKLFGDELRVTMIKCSQYEVALPRGLQSIGPGLGENGKPLKDLVRHYKSYVKGKNSSLNKVFFKKPEEIFGEFDFEGDFKSIVAKHDDPDEDFGHMPTEQLSINNFNDSGTADDVAQPNSVSSASTSRSNSPTNRKTPPIKQSLSNTTPKSNFNHPNWGPSPKSLPGATASAWSGQSSNPGAINVLMTPPRERSGPNSSGQRSAHFQSSIPRNASVPGSSGPTYGPMPGATGPMYRHSPTLHGSMQMLGSMCGPTSQYSSQMPGPMGSAYGQMVRTNMPSGLVLGASGSLQGHNVSMQGSNGPIQRSICQMQGPNALMQAQNISMQRPNVLIQGPNIPMQGPNVPMQRSNVPLQAPNVPMQGSNVPMLASNVPMQGSNVPMQGSNVPMQVTMPQQIAQMQQQMAGPLQQGQNPPIPGVCPPNLNQPGTQKLLSNVTGAVALEFCNLPRTTSFQFLSDKLSQVGQMMSLQLTTPGRLVVQYSSPEHAENCFRKFHRTCLGGNLVEVKYL